MTSVATATALTQRYGRDDAGWMLLVVTLVIIAGLQIVDPFRIVVRGLLVPAGFAALLALIAIFYRTVRPDAKIVTMTVSLLQMTLFSATGAILSYMVAAHGGAPWDARMIGWDAALGLHWLAYLNWLDAHALVAVPLKAAYESLMPQMVLLIVALGFFGALGALRTAIFGAMLAGLITIILSGVLPALGAFVHFQLHPADYAHLHPAAPFAHIRDLMALRDGSMRTLSLDQLQGIISFPSYHAALATVFGWGFSRAPHGLVRWPGMMIAALTLIATPIDGGHYFTDVLAGCTIAAASLWIAARAIHVNLSYNTGRTVAAPAPDGFRSSPSRHSHAMSGQ